MTHVLIVEDHEKNRNLLKMQLEANGYRVTAAGDGLEALSAARREPPDAVVSDVLMPKMDGFALCRAWMQDAALKAIPFIFYSGTYVRPDDADFATALGAVRYLVKPVEAEVFLSELRAVLQQWAGHAAPAPDTPLDDATSHALHESALARKVEDKMAQLEAANRELQESEARFRSLTGMSSDFYWETDAEHRFTVHNASSRSSPTLEFQQGTQIGKRRWELPYISPDEAGWQAHRAVLEVRQPFRNFEFSRLGLDGAARYFTVSGDPVFDASGGFKGYRGVGTDITERKRAEQALRSELQRHRVLMDTAIDGIHIVDGDGYLVEANPAFLAMHGYERGEALGKHLCDWNADFTREQAQANIQRHTDGHDIFETRHRRKDGTVFDVEVSVSGAHIGGKQFVYVAARDITGRKEAERQMARLTRLYALLYRVNEVIAQARSEEELFARICAIAVEHAQLLGAIVRLDEDHTGVLRTVAFSESMRRIAEQPVISNDPALPAYRLAATVAYREGRLVIDNDRLGGLSSTVFMDNITWIGSIAAVPLQRTGVPIGVVVLIAGEPTFFDKEMRRLLERMGLDLSLALDNFGREEQRRRTALALSESEARFRSLTEMSSDYYWETDVEHLLVTLGSGGKAKGVPAVQLGARIGKCRWEIPNIAPDEAGWKAHRAVLDARQPFRDFEFSRLDLDGNVRHISVSGDPIFDASGAFIGYRGVGTDITERKRAEESLRAAEEQFRGLVEQSLTGIYIVQDGKFAYVNPRFAEICGYGSAVELIGRDDQSVVAEENRGASVENYRRLLAGETQSISYDFTGVRKDGSTFDAGVTGARATYRGHPAIIGMMQDISEKKRAEDEIRRYVEQLQTAFMSTVDVATTLSEMRDPYTAGHERRVAEIAVMMGAELGLDERRQEGLRVAGHLHDIGKITIPSEILSKPGRLSPIEFKLIQGHPQSGYDVLKSVEFPWPVAQVALQHHERMDGSGYPQGLKGEAILFEARIMAVADVVEAMSSHRPYRPGLGIDQALAEIERGRGSAYDTDVADACLRLFRDKGYRLPQ